MLQICYFGNPEHSGKVVHLCYSEIFGANMLKLQTQP